MDGNDIFLPGQSSGLVAAGTDADGSVVTREAARLRMQNIPTGSEVAARFPWMRRVPWTIVANEKRVLKRNNFGETFVNSSPRRVKVEEVRFLVLGDPGDMNMETELWVKLGIAGKKEIIGDWMPWHALQTEMDRFLIGRVNSYCFKLPAKYFLQRGSVFLMDVEMPTIPRQGSEALFYISLHGKGALDGEPIDLCKPVNVFDEYQTAGDIITIAFDEDRDMPLRDAIIEYISFGANELEDDDSARDFSEIRVRPRPPDGPRWHDDELFEISLLGEQVGTILASTTKKNPMVIHRPITPYVLDPADIFEVQVWDEPEGQLISESLRVYLLGTQEKIS